MCGWWWRQGGGAAKGKLPGRSLLGVVILLDQALGILQRAVGLLHHIVGGQAAYR